MPEGTPNPRRLSLDTASALAVVKQGLHQRPPVANKDIHEFQSSTDYLSAPVPVTGELPVG